MSPLLDFILNFQLPGQPIFTLSEQFPHNFLKPAAYTAINLKRAQLETASVSRQVNAIFKECYPCYAKELSGPLFSFS